MEGCFNLRHGEPVSIGVVGDSGEQIQTGCNACRRTCQSRKQTVEGELFDDVTLFIAQGFQRAGVDALLVYETCHSGEGHKCRHEIHEDGENVCQCIHNVGDTAVGAVSLCAGNFTPGVDRERWKRKLIHICLRIVQLCAVVCDLAVGICLFVVVFCQLFPVFLFLFRQRFSGIQELCLAVRALGLQFLLCLFQRRPAAFQLLFAAFQFCRFGVVFALLGGKLGFGGVDLCRCLGQLIFCRCQRCGGIIQLTFRIVQLGFCRLELCAFAVQFLLCGADLRQARLVLLAEKRIVAVRRFLELCLCVIQLCGVLCLFFCGKLRILHRLL